jgi:hypothetical protein
LEGDDVNMGGDFILTLISREIRGEIARMDQLEDFFYHLFGSLYLIDVEPVKVTPTWCNAR